MKTITIDAPGSTLNEAEILNASEASVERLYDTVERRLREGREGRRDNPRYLARFNEVAQIYAGALSGNRYKMLVFQEAMKTSDFTHLFGDVLDRQMLDMYRAFEVDYVAYAKQGRVRDFRTVKRIAVEGATGALPAVAEGDNYTTTVLTETPYTYSVGKYGETAPYTWEMMINDDLESLMTLPARFAIAARHTEQRFASTLYTHYYNGYNPTFFSVANKNLLTGASSALSVASLTDAFTKLGQQVDGSGAPIFIDTVTLVVPPALAVTAQNILDPSAVLLVAAGSGSSSTDQITTPAWMRNRIKTLVINPWFPILMGNNEAQSTWFLFADPRNGGRPAMEVGKLIGHEEPEIFMKSPDAMRIGGGLIDPAEGSFANDGIDIKVRHVVGGVLMDPKVAVAASGTAS